MDMKISEETATAINSLAGDINNGFCLLRWWLSDIPT
jgi:hypothetical protein